MIWRADCARVLLRSSGIGGPSFETDSARRGDTQAAGHLMSVMGPQQGLVAQQ